MRSFLHFVLLENKVFEKKKRKVRNRLNYVILHYFSFIYIMLSAAKHYKAFSFEKIENYFKDLNLKNINF